MATELSKGADINAGEGYTSPPIVLAASVNDLAMVKFLVSKKADVNVKATGDGRTALGMASWYGFQNIITYLLSKGAEINVQDKFGQTPLDYALYNKNEALIKFLESKGAECNKCYNR